MEEKSNLKETLSKIVSESLAEDAVNSCENILSCPDIFTKFINSPTKDVEEKIENIIVDINSIIKQNYAFAFINGARKAIEGDYGRSYLSPTVKDDCEYVKNKDFAFIYRFGDNDFGGYFTSVVEEYAKRYRGLLCQINLYNNIGGSNLMTDSYIKEINAFENPDNVVNIFKTLFKGFYLIYDHYNSSNIFSFENNENDVKKALDYLNIKKENFIFGTCQEIDEYIKNNFVTTFHDTPCIWDNGETLYFKVKNGIIDYKVI